MVDLYPVKIQSFYNIFKFYIHVVSQPPLAKVFGCPWSLGLLPQNPWSKLQVQAQSGFVLSVKNLSFSL